VLATTGGGEDGYPMLKAFVEACSQARWKGIVVTGPMALKEESEQIRRLAHKAGVAFHRFIPRLRRWFGLVDAMVSMGGYNTLSEALSVGTPVVCVPRNSPRLEQLIRARAFRQLGLLEVVEPDQLKASTLCSAVEKALSLSRRTLADQAKSVLDFHGAYWAARNLIELAQGNDTWEVETAFRKPCQIQATT
jgi:predicted glycosyltransferase